MGAQRYQHIKTIAKKTNREKLQKTNKMDDLKNLTAEKVIPAVTPEKQEEKMSWELTITLPKKQEEEVLLWQPYQFWIYR